jgi:hypothetical protein
MSPVLTPMHGKRKPSFRWIALMMLTAPPALIVRPRLAVFGSKGEADGDGEPLERLLTGEVGPDALHPGHVREHQSTRFSPSS